MLLISLFSGVKYSAASLPALGYGCQNEGLF